MTGSRRLPAGSGPGWHAWLGPVALGLGLLSWLVPLVGTPIALVAAALGGLSMTTRTEFRIDATAVAGVTVAAGQLLLALVLLLV